MHRYDLLLGGAAHLETPLDKPPNTAFGKCYQSSVPLGWEIFPEWVIFFPFNRKLLSLTLFKKRDFKETKLYILLAGSIFDIFNIHLLFLWVWMTYSPNFYLPRLCSSQKFVICIQHLLYLSACNTLLLVVIFTDMSFTTRLSASDGQELCLTHLLILKGWVWHRQIQLEVE